MSDLKFETLSGDEPLLVYGVDDQFMPDPPGFGDNSKIKKTPKGTEEVVEPKAPESSKETTAGADPNNKDILKVCEEVDPNANSSVLPNMYISLSIVENKTAGNSQTDRLNILEKAFYDTLRLLCRNYSFYATIETFDLALKDNKISNLNESYVRVLEYGINELLTDVAEEGVDNISGLDELIITEKSETVPDDIVVTPPTGYIKQYYKEGSNPYPGYTKWASPSNTSIYVYTSESIGEPYYETSSDEIQAISAKEMFDAFTPYVLNLNLTVENINAIFSEQETNIENNSIDLNTGYGISVDFMGNLTDILGYIAPVIDAAIEEQLPQCVCNTASISSTLEAFSKNLATLLNIKEDLFNAVESLSAFAKNMGNLNFGQIMVGIGIDADGISIGIDAQNLLSGLDLNAISQLEDIGTEASQALVNISSLVQSISGASNGN